MIRARLPYLTPVQAAFVEAWDPFRHEYGPMGGTPGRVFEDTQANRLMDYDTYQLAQQRRRQSEPVVDAASRTRAAGSSSQRGDAAAVRPRARGGAAVGEDEETVESFGSLRATPAYLVNVVPVVMTLGVPIAAGQEPSAWACSTRW